MITCAYKTATIYIILHNIKFIDSRDKLKDENSVKKKSSGYKINIIGNSICSRSKDFV